MKTKLLEKHSIAHNSETAALKTILHSAAEKLAIHQTCPA
jgi:hypothetical protein